MALTDKLTAIGNAIRAKTGGTDPLTLDQMPTEIAGIETGGGAGSGGVTLAPLDKPAAAENIDVGYMAYDADGNVIVGTRGGISYSWDDPNLTLTINETATT